MKIYQRLSTKFFSIGLGLLILALLSIGLTMFLSQNTVEWGALMAAAAIFTAIIVVPFFLFQKQLVGSLKLSGLK